MSIDHQIPREVFAAELCSIEERWTAAYGRRGEGSERSVECPRPSTDNRLVGLAFSGGGVRSAAFHLGLMQGLERRGVFRHVDYLSTVSGGGYIGSSLSCLMRDGGDFPFRGREAPYVTWIRNQANLQARSGLLAYLGMLAVLVRGILFNLLILLPALLLLCSALALIYGPFLRGEPSPRWIAWLQEVLGTDPPFLLTPWVALIALSYFLASPLVVGAFHYIRGRQSVEGTFEAYNPQVHTRALYQHSFSVVLLVLAALAVFEGAPAVIGSFHQLQDAKLSLGLDLLKRAVVAVLALLGVSQISAVLLKSRRVLATLAGWILVAATVILSILVVTEALVWGRPYGEEAVTYVLLLLPGLLAASILLVLGFQVTPGLRARMTWGFVQRLLALLGVAAVVILGPWIIIRVLGSELTDPKWLAVALSVEVWFFAWAAVDVNFTSMLGAYRDELASSYLIAVEANASREARGERGQPDLYDIRPERDVPLSQLSQIGSAAPYHLINATLNLQGSDDPGLRLRKSDFFTFGKHYFGGPRTGYCATRNLERVLPSLDLGTAMAISGAAVSSSMGAMTFAPATPLLALLNVRLGYFAPNPSRLAKSSAERPRKSTSAGPDESELWERRRWKAGSRLLIREMAGRLNETDRHVYLTDGGHIENLGVMELLRRRCKYIVAGDAEQDPEMSLWALATLRRYARMDLGIEIELHEGVLRFVDDRRIHQHCALGVVYYPPLEAGAGLEKGYLLYCKASLTGDEDHEIQAYARRSPAFPHEPTADQFFDEAQFEAYRRLGLHIAERLFEGSERIGSLDAFRGWFETLEQRLAPV